MDSRGFRFTPDSRPHEEEFEHESWTAVSGGGLDRSIYVRVGWTADGRPALTGMVLGADGPAEITPSSLRSIRIGALLEELFSGFSLDEPPGDDDFAEAIEWGLMQQTYLSGAPRLPDRSKTSRGAEDSDLERFARIYTENVVRNPRRAMTATAAEMSVSRATANRWAAQCRERGLLPPVRR